MSQPNRQDEDAQQQRSHYDLRMDRMERDYEDALDRLLQGAPRHPDLQAQLAARGSCKITIRNVAKEAGHSHNPLYDDNNKDRYKDVLERIKNSKSATALAGGVVVDRDETIELREIKAILEREKRDALTENMGLLVRLYNLEEENKRLRSQISRLKKTETRSAESIYDNATNP